MSLLQMSFSGAVMILAVIVIRSVSLHKLPKMTFIVLWAVALLRLLLPYSLPSSLSVYSLASRLVPESETVVDVGAMLPLSSGSVGYSGSSGTSASAGSGMSTAPAAPAQNSGVTAPVVSMPTAPAAPTTPAPSSFSIDPWVAVWLVGALLCALFFAVVYIKCRREFNMSLPVEHEYAGRWLENHRLRRRLSIRQSDRISAPLSYGILKPVILLPKTVDWSDEDAISYVLEHEYVHIRRFDSVMKPALIAAACIHWFNPMVWLMYVLANRDIELSCDEAVIRQFGSTTKSSYAMTLIRMGEQQSGFAPFCNGFSKNAIEERIVAIMKIKKKSVLALIIAFCLVVGVAAACATSAKEPDADAALTPDISPLSAPADDSFDKFGDVDYTDTNTGTCYMYGLSGAGTMFPMQFWTAEEYAELLETAKQQLPELIGMRIYHSDDTVTVVTQELIDERIAWAEETLTEIENGSRLNRMFSGLEEFTGGYETVYWTVDEYSEWLKNERNYLLTLPGTTGIREYTDENGEHIKEDFTWTYDIVYDIIDRYESEFTSIENGLQVSKYYPDRKISFGNGTIFWDGEPLPDISEYEPFGVSFGEMDTALFYKGEKIRYFEDSVELEDGTAIRYNYYRPGGDISIRTVRKPGLNDDGSTNPFGEIVAIEELSYDEATRLIRTNYLMIGDSVVTEAVQSEQELLDQYVPFGLSYELGSSTDLVNGIGITLSWNDTPVHCIYDSHHGVWIANNMHGSNLPDDALDLDAVYENGVLVGLREYACPHHSAATSSDLTGYDYEVTHDGEHDYVVDYHHTESHHSYNKQEAVAVGSSTEEGTTLPGMFDKYEQYGITYKETATANGILRNLYYNGKLVNNFADVNPDGGVFTFGSSEQSADGLTLHAVYTNGKLTGVA